MVALQRALEWRPCSASLGRSSVESADFALALGSVVVGHEAVVLLVGPLATPDPPGEETTNSKHDGTSDTDDDADDGSLCLIRHAGTAAAIVGFVQAGRWGRNRDSC